MKVAFWYTVMVIALLAGTVVNAAVRTHEPGHGECDPSNPLHPCHTAVQMTSFSAHNGVVRWKTAQENNIVGFNIYAGARKINARLVDAKGGTNGHAYVYRTSITAKKWRLQIMYVDGSMSWFDGR